MKQLFLVLSMLFLLLILLADMAFSQNQKKDVVYLKNGSVIRGEIIEQIPNKSIKIQTSDRNIFVYDFTEIEKITKELSSAPQARPLQSTSEQTHSNKGIFCILGGVSLPSGDFAGTTNSNKESFAKTGYTFALEYFMPLSDPFIWLTSLTYSSNSIDGEAFRRDAGLSSNVSVNFGSNTLLFPMTGFGAQAHIGTNVVIYSAFQVGLLLGFEPDMSMSYNSQIIFNQGSVNGSAFAYGLSAGIQIGDNFRVSAKYLTGKPKYTEKFTVGSTSYQGDFERSSSVIQILAGIGF